MVGTWPILVLIGNGISVWLMCLETVATNSCLYIVHHIIPFLFAQEAFGCCSAISAQNGWALYYVRPKIHMFCHLAVMWVWVLHNTFKFPTCEIAEAPNDVRARTTLCRIHLESSKSGSWCSWFDVHNAHVHSVRYVCVCVFGECSVLRLCLLE